MKVVTGGHSILCVSQFTLYAKVNKGNKPDFHLAMKGDESSILYQSLYVRQLTSL